MACYKEKFSKTLTQHSKFSQSHQFFYLKNHVSWEVVDYEDNIFRGWTVDERNALFGLTPPDDEPELPLVLPSKNQPRSLSWKGSNCDHGPINQGKCGSCWAVSAAGMISDRCCLVLGGTITRL